MPKLITTKGAAHYIEQIIKKANNSIILVTPYLRLDTNFIERLRDADKSGVQIILVYGKDKLADDQMKTLQSFENLEIFFYQNLHAKCYFNENSMVITSMNLYEFSEKNNRELGIYLERFEDKDIYEEAINEIKSVVNASAKIKSSKKKEGLKIFSKNGTNSSSKVTPKTNTNEFLKNFDDENFHLPELFKILKWTFKDHQIELKDKIEINNFPGDNNNLIVGYRIDWFFENRKDYNKAKMKCKKNLFFNENGIRCYYNDNQINIYPGRGEVFNKDANGLNKKVNLFFDIIYTIHKDLNP